MPMSSIAGFEITWPAIVVGGLIVVAFIAWRIRARRPHPEAETRLSEYE